MCMCVCVCAGFVDLEKATKLLLGIIADFGGGTKEDWVTLAGFYHAQGRAFLACHAADEAILCKDQSIDEDPGLLTFVADMHGNAAAAAAASLDGALKAGSVPADYSAHGDAVETHLIAAVDLYSRAHSAAPTNGVRALYGILAVGSGILRRYDGSEAAVAARGASESALVSRYTTIVSAARDSLIHKMSAEALTCRHHLVGVAGPNLEREVAESAGRVDEFQYYSAQTRTLAVGTTAVKVLGGWSKRVARGAPPGREGAEDDGDDDSDDDSDDDGAGGAD